MAARDRRVAGDGRKANRERAGLGASTRRGDRKEHCERKKLVGELTDGARRPTSSDEAARVAKRTPFTSKSDCSRAMLAEDSIDAAGGGRRDH